MKLFYFIFSFFLFLLNGFLFILFLNEQFTQIAVNKIEESPYDQGHSHTHTHFVYIHTYNISLPGQIEAEFG